VEVLDASLPKPMRREQRPFSFLFLPSNSRSELVDQKLPCLPKLVTNGGEFGRADCVARVSSPPRGKSTVVLSYEITECALPPLGIQPVGRVLR
jgi:hypothetical protein